MRHSEVLAHKKLANHGVGSSRSIHGLRFSTGFHELDGAWIDLGALFLASAEANSGGLRPESRAGPELPRQSSCLNDGVLMSNYQIIAFCLAEIY
jgi:hypothetical protein